MSRGFLRAFRDADARSLARALALLVVLNACFGAFHTGSVAGAVWGDASLCTSGPASRAGNEGPIAPLSDERRFCCMLGCGIANTGALAEADDTSPIQVGPQAPSPPARPAFVVASDRPANAGPRGPPILA